MVTSAIGTAADCGCAGTLIVRMDSAYYNAAVIGAVRAHDAFFSVTAPVNASIRAAIAAIGDDAWTAIKYPQAVWDDQSDCWISSTPRSPRRDTPRSRRGKARRSPPG